MPTPDDDLRESMVAHKAGRFAEAESGYQRVLQARPQDPKALYYLGLLSFHRGDTGQAIELLQRCLSHAPSNAHAWNTLGGLYIAAGRNTEAREAYRRVTLQAPAMGEGWYNLGICLRDAGDVEGALGSLRASLTHQPDYFRSHDALATLLYRLGRTREAGAVYTEWASRDPQNPTARHMAAAISQQDVPARAADDYVRSLFDTSAKSFDADLDRIGYRAPALVVEALEQAAGARLLSAVLDAGCGTGLCGPLLRTKCATLAGVDLSPQMIERARARACYDELAVAELSDFMRMRPGAYDAIVSADTLVYFGALEAPLGAACDALQPGGVLIFTLEALPGAAATTGAEAGAAAASASTDEAGYILQPHGRYAHSKSYVCGALSAAGFSIDSFSRATLREERGTGVEGFLISARQQQAPTERAKSREAV